MFHPIVMAFDIEIRLDQSAQGIELLTYSLLGFFVVYSMHSLVEFKVQAGPSMMGFFYACCRGSLASPE
jgi:hypothetical protein